MTQPINTRLVKGGPGGSVAVDLLAGAFVKSVSFEGDAITVSVQMADGTPQTLRAEGVTPVATFLRRLGKSTDSTFTEAEILAGTQSMTNIIATPTRGSGDSIQYIGFWIPADQNELTHISYADTPTINRRWEWFTQPVAITVDGTDGHVYPSWRALSLDVLNELKWILKAETNLPVYTRRMAFKAADEAFVAADFSGALSSASTDRRITSATITTNSYLALAVPDDTPDPTSLIQGSGTFGTDYLNQMTRQAGTIEIAGVDYKVWVSDGQYNAFISGLEFRVNQ